jgi:hypothetical protein
MRFSDACHQDRHDECSGCDCLHHAAPPKIPGEQLLPWDEEDPANDDS